MGLRLRDAGSFAFNWRDLLVVVKNMPRSSALYRAMNPDDDATWGPSEYILAHIADATALRLWQAGGGKGSKPKPIPRPTDEKPKQYGQAEPMDQILDWLQDEMSAMRPAQATDTGAERARGIKAALGEGASRKDVAGRFGVSLSTVARIARGEAWASI